MIEEERITIANGDSEPDPEISPFSHKGGEGVRINTGKTKESEEEELTWEPGAKFAWMGLRKIRRPIM